MKNFTLLTFILFRFVVSAQTYTMGSGTVNACAGTFYDSGGSGANYVNNENKTMTFCSSSGNCIKITFTSFNVESSFDQLSVYAGPNAASPLIGTYSGTTIPGPFTGSCLTFVFKSDGSTNKPGWAADISCAACPNQDCIYKKPLCGTSTLSDNNSGTGSVVDLNATNGGCLQQGAAPGEIQSSWYSFTFANNGNFTFVMTPVNNTDDYDFGLWGPNPACPPTTAPLRCSVACFGSTLNCGGTGAPTSSTGLRTTSTDVTEAPTGPPAVDGYVKDITVVAGDTYIMMVNNASASNSGFSITFGGTAVLTNCATVPIRLLSISARQAKDRVIIDWETVTEVNNEYFEVERTADGLTFEQVGPRVQGAGNSSSSRIYSVTDHAPFNGTSFYRLKQVDFNGTVSYSSLTQMQMPEYRSFLKSAFPNPVQEGEAITLDVFAASAGESLSIVIRDLPGKEIYRQANILSRGANQVALPLMKPGLKGIFFMEVTGTGFRETRKIVVR